MFLKKPLSLILPSKIHTITTSLPKERILERLVSVTTSSVFSRNEFRGFIYENGFKIRRNLNYKRYFVRVNNSFNPVIIGKIGAVNENKTTVSLLFRLDHICAGITVFFNTLFSLMLAFSLLTLATEPIDSALALIGTSVFLLLILNLMIRPAFNITAKKSLRRLCEILLANEVY